MPTLRRTHQVRRRSRPVRCRSRPETLPKYRTDRAAIDMSRTYANPLNLPNIEVRTNTSTMAPTDAGLGNSAQMLPILAKDTWVEADGRNLSGRAKAGFRALTENRYRTMADFSPVNYDGTIYLYCSGNLQTNRALYSTRDYRTWQYQEMNLGVTAPTAVRVGGKYYLAGNNTPVYVADSPAGPWTQLGRFTRPDGSTFSAGDVQFFLDDNGRLYLSWNIGAPIMGAELDPAKPNQLISEPVVVFDFDPSQEWMHFGDNKQGYNFAWVEGSQIFKVGNVYYFAVAAGGTEHTSYCTGVLKSRKGPLSGYEYQDGNPIGHALGGDYPSSVFPDAGHGGFVQDDAGNLVFFYTYVIGYEGAGFERRAGMDVCYVDPTGNIVCRLSNTPQLVPSTEPPKPGKRRGEHALADDAGLYNVSTHSQTYWASSYAPGRTPYYATDRVFEHLVGARRHRPVTDLDRRPGEPVQRVGDPAPLEGARGELHREERREVHARVLQPHGERVGSSRRPERQRHGPAGGLCDVRRGPHARRPTEDPGHHRVRQGRGAAAQRVRRELHALGREGPARPQPVIGSGDRARTARLPRWAPRCSSAPSVHGRQPGRGGEPAVRSD